MQKVKIIFLTGFVLTIFFPSAAQCHVYPDSSSPAVGSVVTQAPKEIKIWFDGRLEAAFSGIRVMSEDSVEVDEKNSHVGKSNPVLLEVSLKDLNPGKYHVYWSAVARDGHHTYGDYIFTYKKIELKKK